MSGIQFGENHPKEVPPTSEEPLKPKYEGEAVKQAADLVGVGKTSLYFAKKVAEEAPERLAEIEAAEPLRGDGWLLGTGSVRKGVYRLKSKNPSTGLGSKGCTIGRVEITLSSI